MKKIFLLLAMVSVALMGCKTDRNENPHIDVKAASAATVSPSLQDVIVLSKELAESNVNFSWEAADYGYKAAIKYVVQMDRGDGSFENAADLATVDGTTMSIKASALNDIIVNKLKCDVDTSVAVKIRIGSFISERIDRIFSEEKIYYVETYQSKIIYPSLGLPGNYMAGLDKENWKPDNVNTRIWSVNMDKKYEGYVMMQTETPATKGLEFKFIDGTAWGQPDKGGPAATVDANGNVTGILSGGDNIKGVPSGFYKINVDWEGNKYDMSPIKSVGITGACTTPEWSNTNPIELAYNFETYCWEADVTLKDGEFLILLNHDWGQKLGKGVAEKTLKAGGDNVPGPGAGSYKLKVNFTQVFPTYEFIPQ